MEQWMNEIFQLIRSNLAGLNLSTLSMPGFGYNSVLDILIIAYVFYKVVLWIKETRAWSLFRGLAVLMVVFATSYVLKLHTVIWIIQNAFSVGILAIIVLFQPELRRALEQIGRSGITLPFLISNKDDSSLSLNTTREVIKAVKSMAEVQCGALILLEQDVPLGDHERTGIPMDAVVSSQLLVNIFVDKTPLHDGAVIIRNNRIAAATCLLPLTQTEIGRELGTRHRAAVGASEVSDALVVVVSEETGSISVAKGGKLFRNLSEQDLRNMLSEKQEIAEKKLKFWEGWRKDEKNEKDK